MAVDLSRIDRLDERMKAKASVDEVAQIKA